MHNEGYSTMCGHAVIALGRWAVDSGRVTLREPETPVAIQCPCGLVRARVRIENGQAFPSPAPGWGFSFKPGALRELKV